MAKAAPAVIRIFTRSIFVYHRTMSSETLNSFTAFVGERRIAHGDLRTVAKVAHACLPEQTLVLDDATGRTVDLNLQGSTADIESRFAFLPAPLKAPRGRPKLGVTSREVTLLPRHWDWLSAQPGGASAALRRLVEQARRAGDDQADIRALQDRVYRAMTTLCGNRSGYEEALRALFAGEMDSFSRLSAAWPTDIRNYLHDLLG